MRFEDWLILKDLEKISFIALQKGPGSEQLDSSMGLNINTGQEIFSSSKDFQDTAAVICLCDIVLTNDTSIAHLSGALNKPTWVALSKLPEWRWGKNSEQCQWYKSLTLFRQSSEGEWSGVVNAIKHRLYRKLRN